MDKKVYEFISQKTNDPIVERRTCKVSGQPFAIFQSDKKFYDKISPVFNGVRYNIPRPTLCPEERERRRFVFRNERKLYHRKCDITGKNIISIYSEDKPYKVYAQEAWRSDAWDPMTYGRAFDFTKPFFQQFGELFREIPKIALYITDCTNSEYNNHFGNSKNCYLNFGSRDNEDCLYIDRGISLKKCLDCLWSSASENCYQCIDCKGCYKVFFGNRCTDCANATFVINCSNCSYCFGCSNLVGKQFCIENKQYTKEDYLQKLSEMKMNEYAWVQSQRKKFDDKNGAIINKCMNNSNVQDSFGDILKDCKNCFACYNLEGAEDCKYATNGFSNCTDTQDGMGVGANAAIGYELVDSGVDMTRTCFGIFIRACDNVYYVDNCHNSSNLFGCSGLRNKSYCILNTQYTKEEYEALVPQIIAKMKAGGERGEFFPIELTPFGYNETIAQDDYPLTKQDSLQKGASRMDKEYHINIPKESPHISAKDLPDRIEDVSDALLDKIILCEETQKPFKIIKQELEFYRRWGLPLPRQCPDQRYKERGQQRPPRSLSMTTCARCGIDMLSLHFPASENKVYCEECYNKEIYG